jgi:hypothetical protein
MASTSAGACTTCSTKTRRDVNGITKLRLWTSKSEKRLIEELIPIARFVQARYREGRRIKVRWFSGSQPFDAVLWSAGGPSRTAWRLANN